VPAISRCARATSPLSRERPQEPPHICSAVQVQASHDFHPGCLVLVHNFGVEPDLGWKVKPRYFGPHVVIRRTHIALLSWTVQCRSPTMPPFASPRIPRAHKPLPSHTLVAMVAEAAGDDDSTGKDIAKNDDGASLGAFKFSKIVVQGMLAHADHDPPGPFQSSSSPLALSSHHHKTPAAHLPD